MAAILTVQGGIIMQNRQIDGHGLYLSLLAGLAVLCLAAALVWELAVFALALGAAWLMRRVPGLRKIV